MRMIEQTAVERPAFSRVARFKKRRRFYAAIHHVGLFRTAETNLPDISERCAGIGGKPDLGFLWVSPSLAEIVARTQEGAPELALCGRPQTVPPLASVISHAVDGLPVEIGAGHLPFRALRVGAQQERSFRGANKQ